MGLGLPPCFPSDVEDKTVKTFRMGSSIYAELRYGSLAAVAAASGVDGKWVKIIKKRIDAMRRLKSSKTLQFINKLPYYRGRIWSRICGKD